MRPVRPGDRGPAVEDIQRRLLALGYDLGRTGVDGVYFGTTMEAVRAFQAARGLAEDGIVGDVTWSVLVDQGFTFGDRMLYLRLPHFHGRDVASLQQALNALGFACGESDAIFGAFTERAVREFQLNSGLPADGIVGPETVRTITNLRHVWEGKEAGAHTAAHTAPARAVGVLEYTEITVVGEDAAGRRISDRLVNLAHATTPRAKMVLGDTLKEAPDDSLVLCIRGSGTGRADSGRPLVSAMDADSLPARLITAVEATSETQRRVVIEAHLTDIDDEREDQRAAVLLLDAICSAFD